MKGNKDYKKLLSVMDAADPTGSMMDSYAPVETREYISTGHYLFNAHISGSIMKGVPSNRIFTIAGDPKTGKSFLVYNTIREAQKMGYTCWIFETENALDSNRIDNQGIDRSMLRISQPETVEDIISTLVKFTDRLLEIHKSDPESLPKVALFIDSLTALNSRKQYEDAASSGGPKNDMGTIAKSMHALFRMLSIRCGKLNIPLVCTTHTWDKPIDGTPIRVRTPSSQGSGAIYMSSIVAMLRKKVEKESTREENRAGVKDKVKTGIVVRSDIYESRYTKHIPVTFHISFLRAMNPYSGLHHFLSWDVCGVDKGKWGEHVDLAYEFTYKKLVKPADLPGLVVDDSMLQELSKAKYKQHLDYIRQMVADGHMVALDEGGWTFTEKILENLDENGDYPKPEPKEIPILNDNLNTWVAYHSPGVLFTKNNLFTSRLFTQEVLERLDKVIAPYFSLPNFAVDGGENEELDDLYDVLPQPTEE